MKIGIGPITQLVTMDGIALKGAVSDSGLEIISNGAIIISDSDIYDIGSFEILRTRYRDIDFVKFDGPTVCLPGFIDAHTHICWGGSRSADYAGRIGGKSYQEIAREGGGDQCLCQGNT